MDITSNGWFIFICAILAMGIADKAEMPPLSEPSKYAGECHDILSILPFIPAFTSENNIQRHCQQRFQELHSAHQRHQELLRAKPEPSPIEQVNAEVHPNSHLIVLDLDETIMDQSTFQVAYQLHQQWSGSDLGWAFNNEDLIMNVNQFESRLAAERKSTNMKSRNHRSPYTKRVEPASNVWVGIFRPYFMDFIAFSQKMHELGNSPYDLMLYSAAIPDLCIFHAVTMEIYYNFIYAVRYELKREFAFKYVISRADDIRYQFDEKSKRKSVQILMRLTVDDGALFDRYRHIVIIDDMGSRVWNGQVPKEMIDHEIKFICFRPDAFSFGAHGPSVQLRGFEMIEDVRNSDRIFQGIKQVLDSGKQYQYVTTGRLNWWNVHNQDAQTKADESHDS